MAKIKPREIISFSSEDPAHPASNLLEVAKFRKWRCKEPGEAEACVIFQLEKAVSITGIDVGNECSAIVEVFVSRSGDSTKTFEVLLSCATLMSPIESRELQSRNRVRMFRKDKLDRSVMAQKWDVVKVVCTQPYNKHTQYGLSFITFYEDAEPNEKPKIGAFGILRESNVDDEDDEPVRIGSLFAKRMESNSKKGELNKEKDSAVSTASLLRSSPTSLASTAISGSQKKVKELLSRRSPDRSDTGQKVDMEDKDFEMSDDSSNEATGRYNENKSTDGYQKQTKGPASSIKSSQSPKATKPTSSLKSSQSPKVTQPTKKPNSSASASNSNSGSSSPSTSAGIRGNVTPGGKLKRQKLKSKKIKPFNKLFEDVTFVMSGYQNPQRGELRRKGLKMGGKCKPDWDSSCTHLICAFVNTPKFCQVRSSGRGFIVNHKWIEDSYRKRCRLPWRRYCTDRNDRGPESEEEIYTDAGENESDEDDETEAQKSENEGDNPGSPSLLSNGSSVATDKSSQNRLLEVDDDEPITPSKKRKRILVVEDSDEEDAGDAHMNTLYNADTDVDEDIPNDSKSRQKDFFKSTVFYLYSEWPSHKIDEKKQVEQIIRGHQGTLVDILTDNVEFLITTEKKWNEDFSEALSENPNLSVVGAEWITECEKKNDMISPDLFMILPN